ncbi:hypothetical protein AXG93_2482s1110 [Marchantia polymorpha subsp. ruderalis]|uniref:Uncharacterized protein n=1 Tax=Marchantia polymorpha subsp. ruderalis TaxID=1480154 RepID=A0A176VD57_MARPO|nr:hypothetical protein AXG93_2482s1110 [Marchantia polymorpha subsp. ruderalis]
MESFAITPRALDVDALISVSNSDSDSDLDTTDSNSSLSALSKSEPFDVDANGFGAATTKSAGPAEGNAQWSEGSHKRPRARGSLLPSPCGGASVEEAVRCGKLRLAVLSAVVRATVVGRATQSTSDCDGHERWSKVTGDG